MDVTIGNESCSSTQGGSSLVLKSNFASFILKQHITSLHALFVLGWSGAPIGAMRNRWSDCAVSHSLLAHLSR